MSGIGKQRVEKREPKHAAPRKQSALALPEGGANVIATMLLASGMAAAMIAGSGTALDRAADENSRLLSIGAPTFSTSVSRDAVRRPLHDAGKLKRPEFSPEVIREARAGLSNAINEGSRLHGDSAGKVSDEGTRTALATELDHARTLMMRSTLKSDGNGLDGSRDAIRKAMDAVTGSMDAKRQDDERKAEEAAKRAAEEEKAKRDMASRPAANANTGTGGWAPTHSAPAGEIQQYAREAMGRYGWGDDQWDSLDFIVTHESGWNPSAMNASSGAKGLFQCLGHADCNTPTYMSDYREQVDWGLRYIARRYGTPRAAADYWHSHGSY